MKKFFFFAAAVVAMAACQKGAQPGAETNYFAAPAEQGAPEAVLFSSNVKASVSAKAQGGVDEWNTNQNLKIYGYQRVEGGVDYATAKPLIDNVTAKSPANAASNLLDVRNESNKPYYYNASDTYDFYGYYLDDLQLTPQAEGKTGMFVNLEITGGEDIMVAKADQLTDYNNAVANGTFTGVPQEWKTYYAYSAYAARRGVHPTLTFKHQLVRFRFQITSGSDIAPEMPLKVTKITMTARNTGKLYVAGNLVGTEGGLVPNNTTKELTLRSRNAEGQLVDFIPYNVPDKDDDALLANDDKFVGESLMVIPNEAPALDKKDAFTVNITTLYDDKDHTLTRTLEFDPATMTNPVPNQTKFEAGYSYVVNVKVYSPERIDISADLEEWKEGGIITDDTDDAPKEIL